MHVLPTGIKRIRHYGVLASACKAVTFARQTGLPASVGRRTRTTPPAWRRMLRWPAKLEAIWS